MKRRLVKYCMKIQWLRANPSGSERSLPFDANVNELRNDLGRSLRSRTGNDGLSIQLGLKQAGNSRGAELFNRRGFGFQRNVEIQVDGDACRCRQRLPPTLLGSAVSPLE